MTYSVTDVLHNLNHEIGFILFAGAFIFVGYYIVYLEAIRLGFRDKTHAMPVLANMYFFAHDLTFIFLFQRWFYEFDHWVYKAFWVGIIVFTVFEGIVHYQTLKYSQNELFPKLSKHQYWAVYLGLQMIVGLIFLIFYTNINDYLFLVSFSSTIVISVVFMFPMLYRRKSLQGQSKLFAVGLIISGTGFFFLFLPAMSREFWSLPFLLTGAVTIGLAMIYYRCLTLYENKNESDTIDSVPVEQSL